MYDWGLCVNASASERGCMLCDGQGQQSVVIPAPDQSTKDMHHHPCLPDCTSDSLHGQGGTAAVDAEHWKSVLIMGQVE